MGDYAAALDIYLDDLRIGTCANGHSDGDWRSRLEEGPFLGVRIRDDKPFILDFSNKPEVLFASPTKELRLRPGEQLQVKPILIYPKLDIMIIGFQKEKAGLGFVSPDSDWAFLIFYGIASGVGIAVMLLLSVIMRSKRRIFLVLAGIVTAITVGSAVIYCVVNIEEKEEDDYYDDISPSVTIARSNGEIVATGVMPFN